ncbi:hypothetical protein [Lysobacter olei]
MADIKISELTSAGTLSGTELVEVVQGGANKKATVQAIADLAGAGQGWFNVDSYGAIGDAVQRNDASVTSADATLTSAGAAFTAGDIGKPILIAKSDFSVVQITTIASINSATSIELTAAATFTGTDSYMVYGSDDTTAIQSAMDAAAAAGGGTVYAPGRYVVAGALQDTTRSNAQLLLPRIDAVDSEQISIVLRGAEPPPVGFSVVGVTPLPNNQSVIYGLLNTGTGALIGAHGPVGTSEDFTNLSLQVRNLTIRMPPNPVLTACNFSKVATIDMDHFVVDCGSYHIQGLAEPTTATSYGIRCPSNNNSALTRLGTVNVAGFYNGYEFAEHANGFGTQAAWGCKRAFVFATGTNHASHFQRLMTVHCQRGIVATGTHYVDIAQFNIEHAASGWWVTAADVDDASHYLSGSLVWHVVLAGVGVDTTFTVSGAARLAIRRIGSNGIPQFSLSAATTLDARHANAHVLHPSADTTARTFNIPANSATPYPIGTAITFVNQNGAGVVTIAIMTDTMRLAGAGTTGSRTLAANGMATAVKVTATEWIISGSGLT